MKISVNQKFKDAIITGILSYPIIYIPHFHYNYVEQALYELLPEEDNLKTVLGLQRSALLTGAKDETGRYNTLFENITGFIGKENEFVLLTKNQNEFFSDRNVQTTLQDFATDYERGKYKREKTIVLVSPLPVSTLPPELEKYIMVIDVPAPTEHEIRELVKNELPVSNQFNYIKEELTSSMTRALMGLQLYEIEQIIRSIQVKTGNRLTEKALKYALEEKKSIVRKSGIIEVIDTDVSFGDVAGLEVLQDDLKQKRIIFKYLNDYQDKKMPLPKGILILGMPGCGKSMIAKAIANEFGISLLRLDVNRLMGQYVGQSEENMRKALQTAEAAHPCVLWIDEIEKAFAGANGSSSGNDLVMRLMGYFLTWMQERTSPIYIVATANDALRPELMRKGRFDEVYFVDFPNREERKAILKKKIEKYSANGKYRNKYEKIFDLSEINDDAVIEEIAGDMVGEKKGDTNGFSGAEIEAIVNAVMEDAWVKYRLEEEKARQNDNGNMIKEVEPIRITKEMFKNKITIMKPSVMSSQITKDKDKEKTPVDRIRELQEIYKFKSATKPLSN